jgi:hypothetical protein
MYVQYKICCLVGNRASKDTYVYEMNLKEEIKMQDPGGILYPYTTQISDILYPCPSLGDNILYITLPKGMLQFLTKRVSAQVPVKMFNYSRCRNHERTISLRFLDLRL